MERLKTEQESCQKMGASSNQKTSNNLDIVERIKQILYEEEYYD